MAGAPASMLSVGAVTRIGPRYAVKTQLKILLMRPKPTCKFRVGPQIPLFAPKTILPISIRPLQTKILCPPLLAMGGTNWGSSSLEWLKRNFFELVSANFVVNFADVVAKVSPLFQVFAEFLKKNFFVPVSTKFVAKFADGVVNLAFFYLAFLFLLFVDLKWSKKETRYILKVFESKQNTVGAVGKLVEDVRDLSYQDDDGIDYNDNDFHTMKRRRSRVKGHMERFISQPKNLIIVAEQMLIIYLKHLVSKILGGIFGTISDIGDEERRGAKSSSASSLQEHRQFHSDFKGAEVVIVGQIEEINYLRKQSISEEPKRRIVIYIVGMAGSGKTTLAKRVYDDVKDAFDYHAFITLPREYKIKNVLIDILECVTCLSREYMEQLTKKKLGWMLRDHLKNKRYLVVIDDIWSKEAWDLMLEPILPDVANKSRVICTSRNEKVCPDDRTLRMRLLNDNEAWELFMKTIFVGKYSVTAGFSTLEETILRQILVKCGYLPQAILALGARLAMKEKTITAWSNVLESANSFLTDGSNKCGEY